MNRNGWGYWALGLLPICAVAGAQVSQDNSRLQLSLEARTQYTNNFLYAPEDRRQQEVWGFIVQPGAGIRRGTQRLSFAANVGAEIGLFDFDADRSDYEDFNAMLTTDWIISERNRLAYAGNFNHDHTPFGTERTELAIIDPTTQRLDEWREMRHGLTYRIGIPADTLNLELKGGYTDRTHTTNRQFTRYLDYDIVAGEVIGLYNLSPKTAVFISTLLGRVKFDEIAPVPGALNKSADEVSYRIGTRWEASAKTSGEVIVGYLTRDPRDRQRDSFDAVDWAARVTWSPLMRRQLELVTARKSQESFQAQVAFINNEYVGLEWTEHWTPKLMTALSGSYLDAEFVGSDRRDDIVTVSFGLEYQLSQSLRLLSRASNIVRNSEKVLAERDYDRFTGYVGIRYTN